MLSSSFSDVKATPLHCQVPLSPLIIRPGSWVNLALHMPSLTAAFFKVRIGIATASNALSTLVS